MSASSYVHIDVEEIKRVTEKALLCVIDGEEEVWIPKSQVADGESYEEGDADVTLSVTAWIANEKGLESSDG